ncbi:Na+ dependent nucleoside transporter N-terminal domain-containing protein [Escherichia coli]
MVVLLAIAFLLSVNKKSISLRTVGAALLLQIAIGGIMLDFPPGKWAVEQAALGVHKVMSYSDAGSAFIFGSLVWLVACSVDGAGFIFAFRVLPAIYFRYCAHQSAVLHWRDGADLSLQHFPESS